MGKASFIDFWFYHKDNQPHRLWADYDEEDELWWNEKWDYFYQHCDEDKLYIDENKVKIPVLKLITIPKPPLAKRRSSTDSPRTPKSPFTKLSPKASAFYTPPNRRRKKTTERMGSAL